MRCVSVRVSALFQFRVAQCRDISHMDVFEKMKIDIGNYQPKLKTKRGVEES